MTHIRHHPRRRRDALPAVKRGPAVSHGQTASMTTPGHVLQVIHRDDQLADGELVTEGELYRAIALSALVLHYQPVVDLTTGAPVAVEALVRWQHPTRGLLQPDRFVPLAEHSDLMVALGRWVLIEACTDASAFTGLAEGIAIAVNVSARQLMHPDFVSHVREAIDRSALDPRRLMLEVTESAVMDDGRVVAVALHDIAALGVRIAIDDFGTGFSSLLYLRKYPVSAVKLDRAFVSGLGVDPQDDAICRHVISLAHSLGATSIAEGVETEEQYAALRAFGGQYGQGFLWAPGVALADLETALTHACDIPRPSGGQAAVGQARPGPPAALAVADVVESLQKIGASPETIASALNRAGTSAPSGRRWSSVSVLRLLHAAAAPVAKARSVVPAHCGPPSVRHGGHAYADDIELVRHVAVFLADALHRGSACLVVATSTHRSHIRQALVGFGLGCALSGSQFVECDADALLTSFMRDGQVNKVLFEEAMTPLLSTESGVPSRHAYADLVDVLWSAGDVAAAMRLEELWHQLQRRLGFELFCGYSEKAPA